MKKIPFSLDKYIPGKSIVQTRDGRSVRILATDVDADQPVVGFVKDASDTIMSFNKNGKWFLNDAETNKDLFIVVETRLRAWKPEEVPVGCWYHEERWKSGRDVIKPSLIVDVECSGFCFAARGQNQFVSYDEALEKGKFSLDGGKTWLPCGVEDSQ